jgi:hypothetical protein
MTSPSTTNYNPIWSKDGKDFILTQRAAAEQVFYMSLEGGEPFKLLISDSEFLLQNFPMISAKLFYIFCFPECGQMLNAIKKYPTRWKTVPSSAHRG